VGQLDFSDYAASADLVNDRQFSGNPQLRPDSKVRAGVAWDHRFEEKGAVSLEVYHEWRSDVLEQIILPSGNQALGNAGDATVQGIKLTANLPLDWWIKDGLLTFKADFTDSSFDDPVTGNNRKLTRQDNPDISVDFRQDLVAHQLSWGLGYEAFTEREEYFVNEYNFYRTQGRWSAFIESLAYAGFKVRLAAANLGNERERWDRSVFDGDRNSPLLLKDQTQRRRGPSVSLTVSRTF
jgi:hypothetical protein